MGNTHYCKRRRCHRCRYGYRRDTGNRFYPSQIHGSSEHFRYCAGSCNGWRIHDQRTDRNRSACKRKRRKTDTGSEMADPCSASDCCKIRSKQTADHRTAYPRYSVPDRQRWYCCYPWRFRYRKNHDTASDRQMVQRRHHHLHRLR